MLDCGLCWDSMLDGGSSKSRLVPSVSQYM